MSKTIYHANAVLTTLKNSSPYVSFLTAEPVSDTDYDEVAATNYVRVQPTFGTPADGLMANTAAINFAGNLFNQPIRYIGIFDAATTGHLLRYYAVSGGEWIVNTTDPVSIGIGGLIIGEK